MELITPNSLISFQDHFKNTHGIRLRWPRVLGIVTGSSEMKVVYPFEVCTVEAGQFYKKRVPTELTKSVVEFATKDPQDRIRTITSGVGTQGQVGALQAPVS